MADTLFGQLINDFNDNIENFANLVQKEFGIPQNIIRNEDGSYTIEVAVVGLTKDDLRIKSVFDANGVETLVVENKTVVDATDKVEDKRDYKDHRIKTFKRASWKINKGLDLSQLKAKVENGLLTITIPVAPSAQPKEFVIE